MKTIRICSRQIGPGSPCFIIAEAGVNHDGNIETARRLVDAAAEARADAVKFQTFRADKLVTKSAPKAEYQLRATAAEESQHEMLRKLELSAEAHRELMARCEERGLLFLSTPFDEESTDLLDSLGVAAFKISSGEVTNLPFLEYVASKRKPIILSTGMADLAEVDTAVNIIRAAGNPDLALLQCVSNYPADPADVNLRAMSTMAKAFDLPAGYSDHTLGVEASLAAAALGAALIEKHFTLDRTSPGPDHASSLEPRELKSLIQSIRRVEAALGDGIKRPAASEMNTRAIARRSLVAAVDLKAGTRLDESMIAIKRPGSGMPPASRAELIGKVLKSDLPAGGLFAREMLL